MSERKKRIVFWPDVYKEQGHWLPTLAWAEQLKDNFDVAFMGIADCEEIITQYNTQNGTDFNYEKVFYCEDDLKASVYPLGYTNQIFSTPSNRWQPDHIWALAMAGFDSEESIKKVGFPEGSKVFKNAIKFRSVWSRIQPDILVSGYFTALELLIIYYHHHVPTELFTNEHVQFAFSTTYLRHPSEDPASRALQNLQAFSEAERNKLINIVKNDNDDVDAIYEDPGISLEDFVAPLSDFHEFIPCPKIFDYSHYEHGNKVHYVEPCINKELALPNGVSPIDVWEDFLAEHDKIVFVTAGSQILDYKDKAVILFQSIIDAMQASDMNGYHLIICAGSTLVQELSSDYENVTICGWAPQHTILSVLAESKHNGSCAIIHGGLATIKECVYYDVPFLVLPLGKDQMDNALRLEDCGINNRFHLEYIKPKCLRYFINQILQDYKSRLNLKKLSSIFRIAEQKHTGAKAIAHLAENENLDDFEWD